MVFASLHWSFCHYCKLFWVRAEKQGQNASNLSPLRIQWRSTKLLPCIEWSWAEQAWHRWIFSTSPAPPIFILQACWKMDHPLSPRNPKTFAMLCWICSGNPRCHWPGFQKMSYLSQFGSVYRMDLNGLPEKIYFIYLSSHICIFGLVQMCASLLHANLAMFRFVCYCQPNVDVQCLQQLHEGFNPRFLQHQEGNKCDCMQTFRGFMRQFKASKLCLRRGPWVVDAFVKDWSPATWRWSLVLLDDSPKAWTPQRVPRWQTLKKSDVVFIQPVLNEIVGELRLILEDILRKLCVCVQPQRAQSQLKNSNSKTFSTYWVVGSNFNSPPSSSMAPSSQIVNNDVNGSKVSPTSKYRRIPKHSNLEALRPEFSCQRSQVLQGLANLIITLGVQAFLGLAEKPKEKTKRRKELLRNFTSL